MDDECNGIKKRERLNLETLDTRILLICMTCFTLMTYRILMLTVPFSEEAIFHEFCEVLLMKFKNRLIARRMHRKTNNTSWK